VLKAQILKLAVEKSQYDAVLASETESRLDFEIAINASQNQARIYDSLTDVGNVAENASNNHSKHGI